MKFAQAVEQFEQALALDPKYGYALNMLAYTYADMGEYAKAVETFKKYAAAFPGDPNPLDSLAETYFRMGSLEKSVGYYREALAVAPDFSGSLWGLAYIQALREEYPEALKSIDEYIARAPSAGMKGRGTFGKAYLLMWTGRMTEAISELERMENLAGSLGNADGQASSQFLLGFIRLRQRRFDAARAGFDRWNSGMKGPSPAKDKGGEALYHLMMAAVDLAQGRAKDARSRLTAYAAVYSGITDSMKSPVGILHDRLEGEALLAAGAADKAVAVLEKTQSPGMPPVMQDMLSLYNAPFAKDGLARAYLAQGALDRAVAEYERLTTFDPGKEDRSLINPLYRYRLAKLYERKGLAAKALEQYSRFLVLWKDADRDLPEYVDAAKRVAALN